MSIVIHEASFDVVRNLILNTSKRIEHDNVKTIVTPNHFLIWSWVSEVLLSRYVYVYECESDDSNLLDLCCRAALANTYVPSNNQQQWEAKCALDNATPHFITRFKEHSFLALGYLVFPLLEGIIKQKASEYISKDGEAVKEFSIRQKSGKSRQYRVGQRCSSLRDLLFLFHEKVSDPQLREDIEKIRINIGLISDDQDPFDVIYQWRNDSLHGFSNHQHVAVTMFCFCLIVLLHSIKDDYERIKGNVAKESALYTNQYAFWTYYPPYPAC